MLATPTLFAAIQTWLFPFWLVAAGIMVGMIVLGALYAGVQVLSTKSAAVKRFAVELPTLLNEGFLKPLLIVAAIVSAIALASMLADWAGVFSMQQAKVWRSVQRLPFLQNREQVEYLVPPTPHDKPGVVGFDAKIDFRAAELQKMEIVSQGDVRILIPEENSTQAGLVLIPVAPAASLATDETQLKPDAPRKLSFQRGAGLLNPFVEEVTHLEVFNPGEQPVKLTIDAQLDVEIPEVRTMLRTAGALILIVLGYIGLRMLLPKVTAVASATCAEGLSQPMFYLILLIGLFCLLFFIYIPQNTFGEDIKMYKDAGLTLILILSLLMALWTASVSVSEEIEGKTSVTVLSKPISRRQFVIGKFIGVIAPVAILFTVLGLFFLLTTSFKVIYDARESVKGDQTWNDCYREMISLAPGLLLAYMEVVVLCSICVALSTRLSMLPNLIICLSIYALGHLMPMVVNSSVGKLPLVTFIGQLSAVIVPVLDHFNVQAAYSSGKEISLQYLGLAFAFCALYSTIAMLVALLLFEDRDVA